MKPRTAGSALGGLLGAAAMSVVAGVLVTAAVTPVVALSGAATTSAINIFDNLPDHLNPSQLAQPSTLYATKANGKSVKIATFYDQDRQMVGWDKIPQYVKDAAVAEEDPRFYTHGGVDAFSTARAVIQNAMGSGFSGASTITMQYVRNVLIQNALSISDEKESKKAYKEATKTSTDRKLKEMKLALSVEKKYTKDEILLGYLNIALFGNQIYGIQSAAHYFYGKSAKDLTLPESASLVAMVNEPERLKIDDPDNIPANQARRDKILDSMLRHGRITQAQHDEAVATPVEPKITPRVAGCSIAETKLGLGHFCDYVQRYIKQDTNFGSTPEEREFNFSRGGYKIFTTIDLDIQAAGRQAMQDNVPAQMDGIDPGAASVSTEVGTGRVLAMVQNKPFSNDPAVLESNPGYTSINYNTDFEYGGSTGFQVGSTFKPITLAEWIRTGHSVREIVNVNGRTVQESSFQASCMTDGVYGFGSFTFSNDNTGTKGNQPVLTAIANSVNGGLVSMQQRMDLCDTFETAKKLGIHRASEQTNPDVSNYGTTDLTMVPSNVYGGIDEIAPVTMASAYGAFAGDGTVCTPVPIDKIVGPDGESVAFDKSKCTKALEPNVAAGVAYALQYTVNSGPLIPYARSPLGIPHLAKTGTTDEVKDNWTVGGSSRVVTATWVGNAGPIKFSDGTSGRVSTMGLGIQTADQRIWPAMMYVADSKYGGDPFPQQDEAATRLNLAQIPDLTGKTFDEAKTALSQLGFDATDGGEVASAQPAGHVARTDPEGGSQAPVGSTVTIYRSNGKAVAVPDGLVGATGTDARSTLHSSGFSSVDFVCEAGGKLSPKRIVTAVDPPSGSEVKPSTEITLTLDCKP